MADHDHQHVWDPMGDHDHTHGHEGCCAHDQDNGGCVHDHGEHADDGCCAHDHGGIDSSAAFDAATFGGSDLSGDGGLLKKVVVPGDASEGTPQPGDKVTVHYVGTLTDGTKFDSSRDRPGFFEFDVGVGRVIKGWDAGICSMTKGEKCILACRSDYAYGERGQPPTIPPQATLFFEVELFSWKEPRKDKHAMSTDEQLAAAQAAKEKGTACFKVGKWASALSKYDDACYYAHTGSTFSDDADADVMAKARSLHVSCCLNGATCALKLASYSKAIELCEQALAADADAVAGGQLKAFFRRGTAHMHLGAFADAKADLRRAATLDPKSKEVRDAFAEAAAKEAAAKQSEKALYGKMFG